jgi:hypothetical protein
VYLIQLLLPLYDNEGNHFSREVYDKVRDELTDYFGGATSFRRSPAEGVWEESGKIVFDELIIRATQFEQL